MTRLFRSTTLQDSFSCNFNILIAGMPRVMGVREILEEWTGWRMEGCAGAPDLRDEEEAGEKLHLLKGLQEHPAGHRPGHRRSSGRPRRTPRWCPT
ncbi:MAG: hypothetical protein ACLRWQ_18070 [Flavonifractor plautii]